MYYHYTLKCRDGSFFTEIAIDIKSRLALHKNGKGSRYTRMRLPLKLVYVKEIESEKEANNQMVRFRQFTRAEKLDHINRHFKQSMALKAALIPDRQ